MRAARTSRFARSQTLQCKRLRQPAVLFLAGCVYAHDGSGGVSADKSLSLREIADTTLQASAPAGVAKIAGQCFPDRGLLRHKRNPRSIEKLIERLPAACGARWVWQPREGAEDFSPGREPWERGTLTHRFAVPLSRRERAGGEGVRPFTHGWRRGLSSAAPPELAQSANFCGALIASQKPRHP